jgi:hypothetical protein
MGQVVELLEQQDPFPEKILLKYLAAKNSATPNMARSMMVWVIIHLTFTCFDSSAAYPSPRYNPPW